MESQAATTTSDLTLGSLEYLENALIAFLNFNDDNVHGGIALCQRYIKKFQKSQADKAQFFVLESPDDENGNEATYNQISPWPSQSTKASSSQLYKINFESSEDEEDAVPGCKRRRTQPEVSRTQSNTIGIAQRDIPRNSLTYRHPVIVLAPAQSFLRVQQELLADAPIMTERLHYQKDLETSITFWARIWGKAGQQRYLNFLSMVNSVESWVKPEERHHVVKDMMKRDDPDVLQQVVKSYMLQESMENYIGKGKFDRMIYLADFHQHYTALIADVNLSFGKLRRVFAKRNIARATRQSWDNVANNYIVCCLRRAACKNYEGITVSDDESTDNPYSSNDEHGFRHSRKFGELKTIIELSSSFFILREKFGLGIFVFLLERPITMFNRRARIILPYVIDGLSRIIPDTLTICRHITTRLIEPLMRGEVLHFSVLKWPLEEMSMLELVTKSIQYSTLDGLDDEEADDEGANNEGSNDEERDNEGSRDPMLLDDDDDGN